ncbi:MAG: nucleoside kinase [Chloroflexi bacterium]|nr:nucleoside kinase [Chloroflexota bacterium]
MAKNESSRCTDRLYLTLPDGTRIAFKRGASIAEILAANGIQPSQQLMGALLNHRTVALDTVPEESSTLEPLDMIDPEGMRIYQHTVCLVLIVAVQELYPEYRLRIDHSVPYGGFFCMVEGRPNFTQSELEAIEARMREIVAADEPIARRRLARDKALTLFEAQGWLDKVALLSNDSTANVMVVTLRSVSDLMHGTLAARTGGLHWFSLHPSHQGFILYLPMPHRPTELPPRYERNKIMRVFRSYGEWLDILGLQDITSLNKAINKGLAREIILVSEALHEKSISQIADEILARRQARIVLVAGPSSSGKTTFARRLSIQLRVNGLQPFPLGLDDYFVDRDDTPLDADGERDYEAFEAVNSEIFNDQVRKLLAGEAVELRRYDFIRGQGLAGETVTLPRDAVLVIEGIHGLNPGLLAEDIQAQTFKIYVSALTQLNIDDHNRVSTADSRLLRRMVRDAQFRGYPAEATLQRWESVRRGEEQHIFPYQENADAMLNTALVYELAVLKPLALPLLEALPPDSPSISAVDRLLGILRWVQPLASDLVPRTSLLREFIGGSIFEDFALSLPKSQS